jgi:hypothetical protein
VSFFPKPRTLGSQNTIQVFPLRSIPYWDPCPLSFNEVVSAAALGLVTACVRAAIEIPPSVCVWEVYQRVACILAGIRCVPMTVSWVTQYFNFTLGFCVVPTRTGLRERELGLSWALRNTHRADGTKFSTSMETNSPHHGFSALLKQTRWAG